VPALIAFIAGFQAIGYACADYWQLFGRGVGLSKPAIALFIAAMSGGEAVGSVLAHRLLRGVSLRVLYGLATAAGVTIVAAAATWRVWSIALPLVFTALYQLVNVSTDARFQHAIREETRATVASVKGFVTQCANGVLIFGFGLVAQVSAYRISFLTYGAALMLIGAIAAARSRSLPAPPRP
jgi:hypothetical protein